MFPILFALFISESVLAGNYEPDQIHISPGDAEDEMTVMWSTSEDPEETKLYYGPSENPLTHQASGSSQKLTNEKCLVNIFVWGFICPTSNTQTVHRVTIQNLAPNITYYYKCGSNKSWSAIYNFTTLPEGSDWSPKMIIYGDLGTDSASIPFLVKEAETGLWDVFFHNGDIAYNMESKGGEVGDTFLRQIQPIAAYYPYLVSPGNHDSHKNFTNYKIRFKMPGDRDNMFYSYKIGPVLFVVISTEAFYSDDNVQHNQLIWLEDTLKTANLPENREKRPWIIVNGHRPMYCSTTIAEMCPNTKLQENLEEIFYEYGVDIIFWAHEHDYERSYPVYKGEVYDDDDMAYVNPKAPIHFISGSAGNIRGQFMFFGYPPVWTAFRSEDCGYTKMTVYNSTDIYMEQVSVDKNGEIIDKILIHKDNHGPY